MSSFLLDVWQDLRAKKLWPVAVALALALIAVPVFLARSAPEAPVSSAPSAPPASAEGLPAVAVTDEPAPGGSDLELFSSRDPFRASGSAGAGSEETSSTAASPEAAAGTGMPSGAPLEAGSAITESGGPGGATGSKGGAAAASGSSSPGAPSSKGSSGSPSSRSAPVPAPSSSTDAPADPRTRFYTYAAVVEFGRKGEERPRSLENLEALPSKLKPLVVFLGVSGEGEAVFLLDPRVAQRGEGQCQPTPEECTFLRLRAKPDQDAHIIVGPDEETYKLRLVELRRELDSAGGDSATPAAGARARSASARAARAPSRARRRAARTAFQRLPFDFPFFGERRAR